MPVPDLSSRLREILISTEWFVEVLRAVRRVQLPEWVVAAGIIRNVVWDYLHGFEQPTALRDVDVVFFDPSDLSRERDRAIEAELSEILPGLPWEVTNQAGVHLWYESKFDHAISPIESIEDAVSRNPETATSVGVRLEPDDTLTVVAPCGLEDLMTMVLRRNPKQISVDYFRRRLGEKEIERKWPKVTIIDE
jgi:hypothetical protein